MADIAVERLSLRLSGVSPGEGERLARLIADGLGAANLPDRAPRQLETMNVAIRTDASAGVSRLSKEIVSEILRQLAAIT